MKIIKSIHGKSFKGKDFNITLTPVTAIVGENESGKTAALQALELSLTRQVAGIGSQPHVLFARLASGRDMVASSKFDDGSGVTLSYMQGKKGIETSVGVSGGIDKDWKAPVVLFDRSEFLEMSGPARTKYLFKVLPPPPLDKVGPAAIKAQVKNIKLEPMTTAAETSIECLCAWIDKSADDCLRLASMPVQEWLGSITESIREKGNAATATAKRMRETILGVSQLKSPDAASLAAAEGAVRKATQEHEQAVKELATAREQYRAKKVVLDAAEKLAASYVLQQDAELNRLRLVEKIVELKIISSKPPTIPAVGDKPSSVNERKAMDDARTMLRDAFGSKQLAQATVDRLEKEIEQATHATTCPTCGQDVTEQKKKIIKDAKAELKTAREILSKCDGVYTSKGTVAAMAEGNLLAAEHRIGEFDASVAKSMAEYRTAQASYDEANNLLRLTESQLQSLKDAAANEAPAKAAQESLPLLQNQLCALKTQGEHASAREIELGTVKTREQNNHKQAIADAAAAQQQQKAAEAADVAQAEADVLKQAGQMLVALLAECVKLSVKPLLDTANAMCAGILSSPLAMQNGELGMEKPTGFVGWRSFSGTAQSLAFTALGIALAAGSELKLAIIDDVGRLSPHNRTRLWHRINSLVSDKVLTQAIIVDADTEFWKRLDKANPCAECSVVEIK